MLPVETIEAVFPSAGEVGGITLHPLTLARATFMESLGIDFSKGIQPDNILLAAWILSLDDAEIHKAFADQNKDQAFGRWMRRHNPDMIEIAGVVANVIKTAFSTCVRGANDDDSQTMFATDKGFGWTLELAEFVCHEYGYGMDEALRIPLSRVYAMLCVARNRNGGKNGEPDYYERIQMQQAADQFRKLRAEREKKEAHDG